MIIHVRCQLHMISNEASLSFEALFICTFVVTKVFGERWFTWENVTLKKFIKYLPTPSSKSVVLILYDCDRSV
ncbi:hypothetical protein QL285_094816 [Trifolium repens]|nr:hypothetical protein QL285_094816 [Trifolium repens]